MKIKLMALGVGLLALVALSGNAVAIGPIEVGDWEIDFSGNVNGFYTIVDGDSPHKGKYVAGGLALGSNGDSRDVETIQTGLLPSWFGFGAKTQQNGVDIAIKIGFQPGIDSQSDLRGDDLNQGLGMNSSNFRVVYLTFGTEKLGTFKIGRDIGIFGSDAILNDMTLLGVGTVSDFSSGGGNSTLGRIGVGYIYADWKSQISYKSPSWKGFSTTLGVFSPWGLGSLANINPDGKVFSTTADAVDQDADTPRFEGKIDYTWKGTVSGKAWFGGLVQSIDIGNEESMSDLTSWGIDFGAKVNVNNFEFVAYYYTGQALGTTSYLLDAVAENGNRRDSWGGYVQGTYKLPMWGNPKLGLSYGECRLGKASGEVDNELVKSNRSIIGGIYYPLTKALTLTAEYAYTEAQAQQFAGDEATEDTISLGAILFY